MTGSRPLRAHTWRWADRLRGNRRRRIGPLLPEFRAVGDNQPDDRSYAWASQRVHDRGRLTVTPARSHARRKQGATSARSASSRHPSPRSCGRWSEPEPARVPTFGTPSTSNAGSTSATCRSSARDRRSRRLRTLSCRWSAFLEHVIPFLNEIARHRSAAPQLPLDSRPPNPDELLLPPAASPPLRPTGRRRGARTRRSPTVTAVAGSSLAHRSPPAGARRRPCRRCHDRLAQAELERSTTSKERRTPRGRLPRASAEHARPLRSSMSSRGRLPTISPCRRRARLGARTVSRCRACGRRR